MAALECQGGPGQRKRCAESTMPMAMAMAMPLAVQIRLLLLSMVETCLEWCVKGGHTMCGVCRCLTPIRRPPCS